MRVQFLIGELRSLIKLGVAKKKKKKKRKEKRRRMTERKKRWFITHNSQEDWLHHIMQGHQGWAGGRSEGKSWVKAFIVVSMGRSG